MAEQQVLGLHGSPRLHGNSYRLLKSILEGAASAGAATEVVHVAGLAVEGCRECGGCDEDGHCVVDDDMQMLYGKLLGCTHLVVATPVFFAGVPSQLKAVIDRCQALWVRKYRLGLEPPAEKGGRERTGMLAAVSGMRLRGMFDGTIATIRSFFLVVGVAYEGELVFEGVDAGGDLEQVPQRLTVAREAGVALVTGEARRFLDTLKQEGA